MKAKTLVLAVVAAATVWLLWPLLACKGACIVDFDASFAHDPSLADLSATDTRLNVWILWWVQHALVTDPRALFDANVFWPAKSALAGSEHMLSLAVLTLPLRLFTADAVVVYSAAIVLTSLLTGLAAYALVRWVTGDDTAGVIAAGIAVWMPWRTSELAHLQLLSAGLIPWVWLYGLRVLSEPLTLRAALALVAVWLVQLFASYYVAFFALFSTAALAAVVILLVRPRVSQIAVFLAATLLPVLALAAMSLPYLDTQSTGAVALRGDMPRSLAPAWVLEQLASGFRFGAAAGPFARGYQLPLTVLVLATVGIGAVALARWRPRASHMDTATHARFAAVAGMLAAAGTALVLSFGWSLTIGGTELPLPARFASDLLPGFANLRGSLRWTLVVCVTGPVFAGIGVAALRAAKGRVGRPALRLATFAAVAVIVADLLPPRLATVPAYASRAGETAGLRTLRAFEPGPVLDVPWPQNLVRNAIVASEYMVASTEHAKPILAGYTAYTPRSHDLILRAARNLPRPDAVRRLGALTGLRWIVLHEASMDAMERAAWDAAASTVPLVLAHRDEALTIYELTGSEPDPRVIAAIRSPMRAETTVLGVARTPIAAESARGGFQATLPATLEGYGGGWMKSAVFVRIENHGDRPWPGLDAHRDGLLLVRYRLIAGDGAVSLEGLADLDADVPVSGALDTFVVIEGRVDPGNYRLELELVQQTVDGIVALPFGAIVGPTRVEVAG